MKPPRRRLGLRREAPILLPSALALFAILAITTLVSYRTGIERLGLERRNEALALAERLAEDLRGARAPRLEPWRAALPPGAAAALIESDGRVATSIGLAEDEALPAELAAAAARGAAAVVGPGRAGRPAVVALAPLGGGRAVRLDLPAHALAGQQRSLALLTPLVLGLAIAASIVVALYFRALLRPYEALLDRARAAGGDHDVEPADELDFLVATFDRALAALGAPAGDLAPLAGTLGRELAGGFLLLDPERRVLAAAPAATELLGVPSPAPGAPLAEALAAEPAAAAELARALGAGDRVPRGELALGDGRTLGFTAEPLAAEDGRSRGWLLVVADLTEHQRQEARERLADGLAQLGELAAGVAHELRNGLAALRGWVELAGRRLRPAGERLDGVDGADLADLPDLIAEIDRESRQLARVVDDFLAFARPGTLRSEPCDLVAIARRIVDRAGAGRVALTAPPAPAPFAGDALLVERALGNVVDNALRAHAEAGVGAPVELCLEPAASSWRIAVVDRGAGIPESIRPRLFEPFATGRPDGVGLGLALARRIVVLHGGEIAVESREPAGTAVEIRLPRDDSE